MKLVIQMEIIPLEKSFFRDRCSTLSYQQANYCKFYGVYKKEVDIADNNIEFYGF